MKTIFSLAAASFLAAQASDVPVDKAHEFCSHYLPNGSGLNYEYANCIETVWQTAAQETTGMDRALLKTNMGMINEYGCWCFFEDEFVGGTGSAQDPLDEICKTLAHGYSCIVMDMDTAGTPCTPYDIVYNSAFGSGLAPFGLTMENLSNECDAQNTPGTCEAATCKVEGWFLLSYFTWTVFGGSMDQDTMKSNGFDHDATCKGAKADATVISGNPFNPFNPSGNNGGGSSTPSGVATTVIPPSTECCGDYPVRFPYKHSDDRQCCNGVTYNTNILECCGDASVQMIGACP